ncbi:hypothetical protein Y032_0034g2930 [Ancylostoma ceylanicum]|uniref:Uncharacterized protein n=1 Tax=Ancylostoma ceylanicum TaxID=53326 RepID=A0A016UN77_9BILA|nr:hypothetical protein Y032_0034g2930 [Ancylostoma ceylanicum]
MRLFQVPHCETTRSDVMILLEVDLQLDIIQSTLESTVSSQSTEKIVTSKPIHTIIRLLRKFPLFLHGIFEHLW